MSIFFTIVYFALLLLFNFVNVLFNLFHLCLQHVCHFFCTQFLSRRQVKFLLLLWIWHCSACSWFPSGIHGVVTSARPDLSRAQETGSTTNILLLLTIVSLYLLFFMLNQAKDTLFARTVSFNERVSLFKCVMCTFIPMFSLMDQMLTRQENSH